jgi:hypothetical protein
MIADVILSFPTGAGLVLVSISILLLAVVVQNASYRMDHHVNRLNLAIHALKLPIETFSASVTALPGAASAAVHASNAIGSVVTATTSSVASDLSSLLDRGHRIFRAYRDEPARLSS